MREESRIEKKISQGEGVSREEVVGLMDLMVCLGEWEMMLPLEKAYPDGTLPIDSFAYHMIGRLPSGSWPLFDKLAPRIFMERENVERLGCVFVRNLLSPSRLSDVAPRLAAMPMHEDAPAILGQCLAEVFAQPHRRPNIDDPGFREGLVVMCKNGMIDIEQSRQSLAGEPKWAAFLAQLEHARLDHGVAPSSPVRTQRRI